MAGHRNSTTDTSTEFAYSSSVTVSESGAKLESHTKTMRRKAHIFYWDMMRYEWG